MTRLFTQSLWSWSIIVKLKVDVNTMRYHINSVYPVRPRTNLYMREWLWNCACPAFYILVQVSSADWAWEDMLRLCCSQADLKWMFMSSAEWHMYNWGGFGVVCNNWSVSREYRIEQCEKKLKNPRWNYSKFPRRRLSFMNSQRLTAYER